MERALSAPGKLFLAGEYAVLWGGAARIAAVGPRTEALVRGRSDREVHLVLADGRLKGRATPMGVHWEGEGPAAFRFAARAVDEVYRAAGRETLGFELALSPSPVAENGEKLGMGGSARACVLAAEAARFSLGLRADTLKLALLAHASAQGMKGSGGDVAASFAGGVVRYRRYDVKPLAEASNTGRLGAELASSPPVDLWRLPAPKVFLSFAYVGKSASTRALIAQVEALLDEAARAEFVSRSNDLGQQLEDALQSGDFAMLREAVEGLEALLATLGPVETEPVRRVLALARSHGSVAKISGAGGGDGCVIFSPDAAAQTEVLEAFKARGIFAFHLELEDGLRGEVQAPAELRGWLRE